jgi:hypothetical protein
VQVVTNTVTGLAGLAVLVMVLVKQGELRTRRRLLVSAAGATAVLTAAAVCAAAGQLPEVGGARAAVCLGAVLAVSAILGAIPQPLSLLRDRGQDLAGLSPARWWLAAGACTSWTAYGLATGQLAVWLSALVGLSSALIVCSVLLADRRARTAVVTPVLRAVHHPSRVVRPAQTPAVRPAPAQVLRPAPRTTLSTVSAHASATARPVYGTARVTRPTPARPARGVARVPRPADRPTLIMNRDLVRA